jgi:hypothetical protein
VPSRKRVARVTVLVIGILAVDAVVAACGGSSPTTRPSPSLITLDFSPVPTVASSSPSPRASAAQTAKPSTIAPTWPAGWDVAFCTAFTDTTVAHQLVIDIERAIADGNRSDAQGLANELAQTAPLAGTEMKRLRDWDPATDVKTNLTALLDLDTQVATAYQSYFNDDVKSALHDARQLRNQVGKQVTPINTQLQTLTDLGVSCPGTDLALEKF